MVNFDVTCQRYRALYEDELLERLALPVLGVAAADKCIAVREAAAKVLEELATHAAGDGCTDLLDLMEKVSGIYYHNSRYHSINLYYSYY